VTYHVNVTRNSRIILPADVRKRLGLADGGELILEETQNGLVLRTLAQAIAEAQEIVLRYTAGNPDATVDAFLANRRAESGE
jgi:AbrB family looped-hinge helix DNA binding protein